MSMTVFAEDTRTQVNLVEGTSPDFTPIFGKSIDSIRPEVTVTTGSPAHFEHNYWRKYDEATGQYNRVDSGSFTKGKWRYDAKVIIDGEGNNTHALANGVVIKVNGVQWDNIQGIHGLDHGKFTLQYVKSPVFEVDPSNSQIIVFNADNTDLCDNLIVGTSITSVNLADSVEGGTAPYSFNKLSGPEWIDISSSGVVTGTPTAADAGYSKDLVFRITDKNGTTAKGTLIVPYVHNVRTTIKKVECTSPDYTPVYGEKVDSIQPKLTVTEGAPAYIETKYWRKYNEETRSWETVKNGVFTGGKWEYSAVVRVDGENNKTHTLSEETLVKINGQDWEVFPKAYIYDDRSLLYIYSSEFEVEVPESLTGNVSLSKAYYNDPVNPVLSDNLKTMNTSGKLSFQWQRSDDGTDGFKDISGATNQAYYPSTSDVGKYIRVVITADGYISSVISNSIEVKQALINFEKPVTPTLSYDAANGLTVTNAKANQEYLVTYNNNDPSDWSSSVKPSTNGSLKMTASTGTTVYVHTRVAETIYKPAGRFSDYNSIYTGTPTYLVSFDINYSKLTLKAGDVVELTSSPIPANATSWSSSPGVQWYVNGSSAKLYKDAACTQEYNRYSDGYCESVYLKGLSQSNWFTVGAERTISGGIPTVKQMNAAVTDTAGNYILERLAFPDVTLAPGESVTVDISSYPDPSKVEGNMTFTANSSNPASTITLTPLDNNTKLKIDVPSNAMLGEYGYDVKLDGTLVNRNVWTITVGEKNVPVSNVSVLTSNVTLAPGTSMDLTAVVSPSNATDGETITWSRSSGSDKITVDNTGRVTVSASASAGLEAVIKAEAGGKSGTCTVKVGVPEYGINVINGKAYSGGTEVTKAKAGTSINLAADAAPPGKIFLKWKVVRGDANTFNATNESVSFDMPDEELEIVATYVDIHTHNYQSVTTKATTSKNGTVEKECSICGDKITETIYYPKTIKLSYTSTTYNGKVKSPTVSVVDAAGNKLVEGTDYDVTVPTGRVNAGTYTYKVVFKGNYSGSKTLNLTINQASYTPTVKGYSGTYDGKKHTISFSGLKSGSTIKYRTSPTGKWTTTKPTRTSVGKTTVYYQITNKNYKTVKGSKTIVINPVKTSITSLSKGTKSFTVKWAKKTTQTTGYQIQYSTSSTFASGNKTVTVTSNKTTSKTIKSLKAKKKYYVRVRTYKTVNGVKYYSGWSAKKYVTTK